MEHLVTLQERLTRALPGAETKHSPNDASETAWSVCAPRKINGRRRMCTLATGSTEREAIDRAIFLFGAQR